MFSGAGHRLGAPVPDIAGSAGGSLAMPGSFSDAPSSSSSSSQAEPASVNTKFEVDQNKPMTSVQIRLADGTRCVDYFYE